MDALSNRLAAFLRLMRSSALLITDGDRAHMDVLLTMLGALDKDIVESYFGLRNQAPQSVEQLAAKHHISVEQMQHIIGKVLMQFGIDYKDFVAWRGEE